jgi:hypothetical protein
VVYRANHRAGQLGEICPLQPDMQANNITNTERTNDNKNDDIAINMQGTNREKRKIA